MIDSGRQIRVIISGGGTGGHLFPAIAVANAIRSIRPATEILFVGAEGRMEMEKVPEAGYEITGLPVAGFVRRLTLRNVTVIIKLVRSMLKASRVVRDFSPDVVIGVGGYASGPLLRQAQRRMIPTLLQEQNSYAGVTNKLLARRASVICVAYEGMEKYFPADKIMLTGNPVRRIFSNLANLREEAAGYFGLDRSKPVILILGGSLGAGTINNSIAGGLDMAADAGVQLLWQTGSHYYDRMQQVAESHRTAMVTVKSFISRMDLAYAAADLIISRAGAGTISELAIVGKPVILVPSPNVAEDHQTHNALALVNKTAALLVADADAGNELLPAALQLIKDRNKCTILSENIRRMALYDADEVIAREALKLAERE